MKDKHFPSIDETLGSIAIGSALPEESNAHKLIRLFEQIALMDDSVSVTCVQLPDKDFNMLYITNKPNKEEKSFHRDLPHYQPHNIMGGNI